MNAEDCFLIQLWPWKKFKIIQTGIKIPISFKLGLVLGVTKFYILMSVERPWPKQFKTKKYFKFFYFIAKLSCCDIPVTVVKCKLACVSSSSSSSSSLRSASMLHCQALLSQNAFYSFRGAKAPVFLPLYQCILPSCHCCHRFFSKLCYYCVVNLFSPEEYMYVQEGASWLAKDVYTFMSVCFCHMYN